MKYSAPLPQPIEMGKYRYVAVRYRARNAAPWGDYFIWLGSEAGGTPQKWAQPVKLYELNADDTWRVMIAPIREDFTASHLALQVGSAAARGDIWLDYIRFCPRRPLIEASDLLPVTPGWETAKGAPAVFQPVDISAQAAAIPQAMLMQLGLRSWLPGGRCVVYGVPFDVPTGEPRAVMTPADIDKLTTIPVAGPPASCASR